MNQSIKKIQKNLLALKMLIVMVCIFFTGTINAQSNALGPPDPCVDPFDPCPIDGGVFFLIALVIFIAAKKAFDNKKQKQAIL